MAILRLYPYNHSLEKERERRRDRETIYVEQQLNIFLNSLQVQAILITYIFTPKQILLQNVDRVTGKKQTSILYHQGLHLFQTSEELCILSSLNYF